MMSRLFVSFLLSLLFVPSVFAQQLTIQFQTPDDLVIDEEVVVTIEVMQGGDSVEVDELTVSYVPQDGVFDEVVYDCNDPSVRDNCRANNRGVPGVFEAVFDLKKLPLMVVVDADGTSGSIQLSDDTPAAVVEEETIPEVPEVLAATETAVSTTVAPAIAPESIQVGPAPSWVITLIALGLMCFVVSYFVVKTTD